MYRLPRIAGAVVDEGVGNSRQSRVVLCVAPAELVDHRIERRYDENSETACARLVVGVVRRTDDMGIRVVFELQRKGQCGLNGEGLLHKAM